MKIKHILIGACLLNAGLTSCLDDEFLDRTPIDKETAETVFTTSENFKMYAWGLYKSYITGYSDRPQSGDNSDMLFYGQSANGIALVNNRIDASNISSGMWDFTFIRQVNLMLDNIDQSSMSEKDKEHWRSVGFFFRSWAYFDMMKDMGELPWLEHVVKTTDTEILYGKKDSREVVANNILENLLYAESHIKAGGDGANTINSNVIRALISRFGLFEGTWRKYHGAVDGVDAAKYLNASVVASQSLIDQNLGLMGNFDDVFNSLSLKGQKSILLFKEYLEYDTNKSHQLTNDIREYEYLYEGTKRLVENYLCADGKPISTSPLYKGDEKSLYDEFENRDHRLYYTICPPYAIKTSKDRTSWEYTDNPEDRKFIDMMNKLAGNDNKKKTFPLWNTATTYSSRIPNLEAIKVGGVPQRTGYYFYLYYNNQPGSENRETAGTDAPIFRMGEVLVNHAEAMFELGKFDQTVADATINQLRKRANVAPMVLNEIGNDFDAYRDTDVNPILWEIRRERCSELMGQGFRFNDIKRWKKGEYLNLQPVGVKINDIDSYQNEALANSLYNGAEQPRYKNCVTYIVKPNPGWSDKCYLYPIPIKQITLNKNLVQNPGWE